MRPTAASMEGESRKRAPDAPSSRAAVAELLSAMASLRRIIRRLGDRPAVLSHLTNSQLEVVHLLRHHPGVSVAEAADRLSLAPNTVSTIVSQLCDAGLLVRMPDGHDGRVIRLDLEAGTRQEVSAWGDRRVDAVVAAIGRLSRDDRRCLEVCAPLLNRLADALATGRARL